ncbi:MAG: HD domain-containing protein [Spirochaetales bacterium]|nr:HD domain-containing protein [Spirochaetales bacterium]
MALLQKLIDINRGPSNYNMNPDYKNAEYLLKIITAIYNIKDLDTLLERILLEARGFVNADAGTIYLSARNHLYFNYVQNDTLFHSKREKDKYIYSQSRLQIDKNSLAGYVALTGQPLLIDDVYDIKSDVSYNFDPTFDKKTSYRTQSILVVPLVTRSGEGLGVLQLINAKDATGKVVPFSMIDNMYISQFAFYAANAIETAKLSRQMALRMIEIVELRDPGETSVHAKRVGAYAIELFEQYAKTHGIGSHEARTFKEQLRFAAILHDMGKVAISDIILKKKGALTPKETQHVHYHTIYGARLFKSHHSPWDKMATEVALNHHEKWDGTGYPGKIPDIYAKQLQFGPGKKGKEIPLSARIVTLSDVYDSLSSKRVYKEKWEERRVLQFIQEQSGKHFDPELVKIFFSIHDTITAIKQRYVDVEEFIIKSA